MNLPWRRRVRKDRLVMACNDEQFVYVHAEAGRILRCGVELRGGSDSAAFARRVRALGLPAQDVRAVLALADCQLLQIEAPAVPAQELKAAARWRIKDLIDTHIDDLTLDVMHVGDGRNKAQRQLFVVAANSRRVRELGQWCQAARLQLTVIEIRETAQRNLQTAITAAHGQAARAIAALTVDDTHCLLTICAQGELFYARRLEWQPASIAVGPAGAAALASDPRSDFADLHIVDYGAEYAPGPGAADDVPPLVIELQRSFDLWERSWPDLPLARLVVHAQAQTATLADLLGPLLPMVVEPLDAEALFPGFAAAAGSTQTAWAATPLLGALLRVETRQL